MVTHDPSEAARLSTDIILVQDGFSKVYEIKLGDPLERSPDDMDLISRDLLSRMKKFSSYLH